jgi:[acyl-carrier-protein] S-malonyltransferase
LNGFWWIFGQLREMSKTAFLFPGQGSQTVGMGRGLATAFSIVRQTFEEADDALGFSLSDLCFYGPEGQLRQTEFTQPAIFTASIGAFRVLAERGITPDYVAGHSLGEYSANVAAGVLKFSDAVRTVRKRGQLMQQAVAEGHGAMAAVLGMHLQSVDEVCRQASRETAAVVAIANMNSPEQTVISGTTAAVERAIAIAKERGARRAVALHVSAPFHCALMQPAEDALRPVLEAIPFSNAQFPVVVNVDAVPVTEGQVLRQALIRQVMGAVRWTESVQRLIAAGVTSFIEVGPGKVLSGLMRQIERSQKAMHVEDCASLEKTLAAVSEGKTALKA